MHSSLSADEAAMGAPHSPTPGKKQRRRNGRQQNARGLRDRMRRDLKRQARATVVSAGRACAGERKRHRGAAQNLRLKRSPIKHLGAVRIEAVDGVDRLRRSGIAKQWSVGGEMNTQRRAVVTVS